MNDNIMLKKHKSPNICYKKKAHCAKLYPPIKAFNGKVSHHRQLFNLI